MDHPEGEKRDKHYYDSGNKPQGSTDKLPSVESPLDVDSEDIIFATNDFNVIESSPVHTGPTSNERPPSGPRAERTPSALAPTVDAFQLTPPPSKKTSSARYAGQTRKLSMGPSNLMLAVLWMIAAISVGWAAYFYLTQP